jgi:hypothetical protein
VGEQTTENHGAVERIPDAATSDGARKASHQSIRDLDALGAGEILLRGE